MTLSTLLVPEELLLLSLRDRDGEFLNCWVDTALGAGLLAELLLGGHATLQRDRPGRTFPVASEANPPEDELLAACARMLSGARRRATTHRWIERFAAIDNLRDRVARRLVAQGVVRCDDRKILVFFHHKAYPEVDHGPEAVLVRRLRDAIERRGDVDARTLATLAVADAAWSLKLALDPAFLKQHRERIDALVAGNAIAAELAAAVREVEAAITAESFSPSIYAPPTSL